MVDHPNRLAEGLHTLRCNKRDCCRFFSHNSSYVHGGVEKPGEEQPPVKGQAVSCIHSHSAIFNGRNVCHVIEQPPLFSATKL